jgi:hypothetical protein
MTSLSATSEYLQRITALPADQKDATKKYRNPVAWSKASNYPVYGIGILTTLIAAYSISAYVAGVPAMAKEFDSTETVALVGMATFQTGFAAGPMVLVPLSKINGRKPIFLGTYALLNGESFDNAGSELRLMLEVSLHFDHRTHQ